MLLIIQLVHHCIKIFNLSLSTSMDPVFQQLLCPLGGASEPLP